MEVTWMGGRHAKPIALHLQDQKKHLTKEEIAARQEQEQKLKSGIAKYKPNEQVLKNPMALSMFKKLKKLYKNIEYVEGLDENVINRYCLLSSQEQAVQQLINHMYEDVEECQEFADRMALYEKISKATATLNKTRDMLLKIEDRLLLNPTARIKNVPHKEKTDEQPPSKFGRFAGGNDA
jgi:phage terminase small subunit